MTAPLPLPPLLAPRDRLRLEDRVAYLTSRLEADPDRPRSYALAEIATLQRVLDSTASWAALGLAVRRNLRDMPRTDRHRALDELLADIEGAYCLDCYHEPPCRCV